MMVLEGRLLVSLVGKKCGGQSFDDIIMVARANKNHKQRSSKVGLGNCFGSRYI